MPIFGELRYRDLRSIWPNESQSFTPWLAENIQKLGEVLGMDLELIGKEASVGDFSLDLLAKDLGTGHAVIIENQFGATNHDHLGKLLTYAAGYDASTVIWISEAFRDEHRSALDWLNKRIGSDTQFFGITVEVFEIDESKPAYRFRLIVSPDGWERARRSVPEGQISPKAEAYRQYFQKLIDELREQHRFTAARVGQPQSWYSFSSGMAGITYGACFAQGGKARVELYIDLGDAQPNKQLFEALVANRQDIEREFGEVLEWERLDDRRASRIALYRAGSIADDEDTLTEMRTWMIEHLLKMKRVFSSRLRSYKKKPGRIES